MIHLRFYLSLQFFHVDNKHRQQGICSVVPDEKRAKNYLIYFKNRQTDKKILFGQLSYQNVGVGDFLYTIIFDNKLYQVRSCDLKDRRLTIIDTVSSNDKSKTYFMRTLLQVTDSFAKSTKTYHVVVNEMNYSLGYLAIVILLGLHESKQHP